MQSGLEVRVRRELGADSMPSAYARLGLSASNPFGTSVDAAGETGETEAGRVQNGCAGSLLLAWRRGVFYGEREMSYRMGEAIGFQRLSVRLLTSAATGSEGAEDVRGLCGFGKNRAG